MMFDNIIPLIVLFIGIVILILVLRGLFRRKGNIKGRFLELNKKMGFR